VKRPFVTLALATLDGDPSVVLTLDGLHALDLDARAEWVTDALAATMGVLDAVGVRRVTTETSALRSVCAVRCCSMADALDVEPRVRGAFEHLVSQHSPPAVELLDPGAWIDPDDAS
jgi:hypothetical protein